MSTALRLTARRAASRRIRSGAQPGARLGAGRSRTPRCRGSLLVEPGQTSQRALEALTDGSSVMDVTTMLKRIPEDIALALRRFKIAPEDIPAQVREFERRVRN